MNLSELSPTQKTDIIKQAEQYHAGFEAKIVGNEIDLTPVASLNEAQRIAYRGRFAEYTLGQTVTLG